MGREAQSEGEGSLRDRMYADRNEIRRDGFQRQVPTERSVPGERIKPGAIERAGLVSAIVEKQVRSELDPYFGVGVKDKIALERAVEALTSKIVTDIRKDEVIPRPKKEEGFFGMEKNVAQNLSASEMKTVVGKNIIDWLEANQMTKRDPHSPPKGEEGSPEAPLVGPSADE